MNAHPTFLLQPLTSGEAEREREREKERERERERQHQNKEIDRERYTTPTMDYTPYQIIMAFVIAFLAFWFYIIHAE